MSESSQALIERVNALIDRSPSLEDLRHHRIELLAARRRRELGLELPDSLIAQERLSAAATLAAPVLLERVRAASDGPLVLFKGPRIARLYPDRALRSFRDLDVLVADADATQRSMLAAGFLEAGDPDLYEKIHHLRPLHWPGLPLVVEVHHSPKWVEGLEAPAAAELIEAAVPCAGAPDGVLELPAAHHALVLAAHAWAHRPLSRLRDLLDIRLVAEAADPAQIEELARAWGLRRIWATTAHSLDALFDGTRRPASLAIWARHLEQAREQTVLESHVQNWLCALWGLPGGRALATAFGAVGADLVPERDEGWPAKLGRTRAALANAFVRKSQHDEGLTSTRGGR